MLLGLAGAGADCSSQGKPQEEFWALAVGAESQGSSSPLSSPDKLSEIPFTLAPAGLSLPRMSRLRSGLPTCSTGDSAHLSLPTGCWIKSSC